MIGAAPAGACAVARDVVREAPPLVAWPPPGFVPLAALGGPWSVSAASLAGATVTVRDPDGAKVGSSSALLDEGYGLSTISVDVPPPAPAPGPGDEATYEVAVEGLSLGTVTYEVRIVDCD